MTVVSRGRAAAPITEEELDLLETVRSRSLPGGLQETPARCRLVKRGLLESFRPPGRNIGFGAWYKVTDAGLGVLAGRGARET